MRYQPPAFLEDGVFEWDARGYQFASEASVNLLASDALHHENPWVVLGAVLARAKQGQFTSLALLLDCVKRSDHALLWSACFELLGDAGPSTLLRNMVERLRKEVFEKQDFGYQLHVSRAFHQSLLLWTVPEMLAMYGNTVHRGEIEVISVFLSRLLEPDFGPIAGAMASKEEYAAFVKSKYEEMRAQLGTDQVPVLYGERFSVAGLAERLYAHLQAKDINEVTVLRERHFFEAATGIDCSSFYLEEELQPLSAAAIVEEFLESPEAEKYEDGVRYFFGHRIPD